MRSMSNVFLKGHGEQMDMRSRGFTCFDRNLNTGRGAVTDATMV